MRRLRLALLLAALPWVPGALPARGQTEEGRNLQDRFEIEGHFGLLTNLAFPAERRENPRYTAFLANQTPTLLSPLFRPDLDTRDVYWEGGLRFSYDVRPRWALEYSFSSTRRHNFEFQDSYVEEIFPQAQVTFPTLTMARAPRSAGRVSVHWLNVVFHTRETGRFVPYLTGGVNAVHFGRGPEVEYTRVVFGFTFFGTVVDRYRFAYQERFTRFGVNGGGGVKLYLTRHLGIRSDARLLFSRSEFTQSGRLQQPSIIDIIGPPIIRRSFGPNITSQQRGLYSSLYVTFGVFGRF